MLKNQEFLRNEDLNHPWIYQKNMKEHNLIGRRKKMVYNGLMMNLCRKHRNPPLMTLNYDRWDLICRDHMELVVLVVRIYDPLGDDDENGIGNEDENEDEYAH